MKYTVEISDIINEFKWWSGALDTIKDIREAGLEEEFNSHIEETFMFDEEPPRDVDINDYVWHDRASVYAALGLDEDGKLPDEEDEDGDPLLLQVDGRPMTEDEAEQLKDAIFSGGDEELLNAAKEAADEDAFDMENYEYSYQIPNHVINVVYGEISFTAEDFACNV